MVPEVFTAYGYTVKAGELKIWMLLFAVIWMVLYLYLVQCMLFILNRFLYLNSDNKI